MIIDTHVHYDDEAFDADREELLAKLPEAGIGRVIDIAASAESLDRVVSLTERYDFVYGAVGLHPDEVGDLTDEVLRKIEVYINMPKIVAVGEIGLDYYWDREAHERQIEAFRTQIRIAQAHGKPIVIHSREAAADTIAVVTELYGKGSPGEHMPQKGVMHCYSCSPELAEIYTNKLGFCLGIGGVVTYKNSHLAAFMDKVPLEDILLETDAPYLAPEPYRGKRNASAYLPHVVDAIAEIKGISREKVTEQTTENARRLFVKLAD